MRQKKEERPRFKVVAHHEIEGASKRDTRILNIDNRRSDSFGGYTHDVRQIITEDELWEALGKLVEQKEIAAKQAEKYNRHHTSSFDDFYNSSSLAGAFSRSARVGSSIFSAPASGYKLPSLRNSFAEALNAPEILKIFDSITDRSFLDTLKLPEYIDFPPIEMKEPPFDPFKAWKEEQQFRSAASWRMKDKEKPSADWIEAQKNLKPSLLDEDDLGSFDDWMDFTPLSTQYLLIGDTNHGNKAISTWLSSGVFLVKLKEKGFTDVVMERPYENKTLMESLNGGDASVLDEDVIMKHVGDREFMSKAHSLGLRVHCLDWQISNEIKTKSEMISILYERHKNDEVLAEEIKKTTGDRKTAVIYGSAHFAYENGLADLLGHEKCRHVNIHENLEDYLDPLVKQNARFPAPYVYVIEEDAVIASRGRYQRDIPPAKDSYLKNVVLPSEEEKNIDKFSADFENVKSSYNSEIIKNITVDAIVEHANFIRLQKSKGHIWDVAGMGF
jgi:hypothetical protein